MSGTPTAPARHVAAGEARDFSTRVATPHAAQTTLSLLEQGAWLTQRHNSNLEQICWARITQNRYLNFGVHACSGVVHATCLNTDAQGWRVQTRPSSR